MALSDGVIKVRLRAIEYGVPGINLYTFESLDGQPLPAYEPGAHVDVAMAPDVLRQYSLLWPAVHPTQYRIAVQLSEAGKGGSRKLHFESVVGAEYALSAPRNHFPLRPSDEAFHLFAGGIGITPLISMYRQLKASGRSVTLYYWASSPQHMLFHEQLCHEQDDVRLFHTRTGESPPRLNDVLATLPDEAQLYCCGPQGMVDEFDRLTQGRPEGNTHRERFSATTDALQPGDSFRVTLQRSGMTLTVPAELSLLQVCEAAGVDVAYSCEEGVCGACEVRVLAGQVEHRDTVLTPGQRQRSESMMICCSRGVGEGLVLDL
ncbi:PDR/VanB family oxidoreductase [Pseudomonas sp. GD03842]|uniref:PDR/VanB family oxidoreductase n=1 Tax=Pseudomonas sp. GD03842 TaxID=2975385 RepID=UPI00244D1489|nr:PDR/VanB family oxidoreductase [Pseudomonas sp. GD03842]MDH0744858.1 PDR/VanB family oxidoreductase [Pseudomonas sp. GD03842]